MFTAKTSNYSERHLAKLNALLERLNRQFELPVNDMVRRRSVLEIAAASDLGVQSQREVIRHFNAKYLKRLPVKWDPGTRLKRTLYSTNPSAPAISLVPAFFKNGYLSFGSALHWNQLTDQVPSKFFISTERGQKREPSPIEVDHLKMRDAFIKDPRDEVNVGTYHDSTFVLLERPGYGNIGIISRSLEIGKQAIDLHLTDLERTLLDCAVYPHRAGGVGNVGASFRSARRKISLTRLAFYYQEYALQYPYWQRIGFYLSKFGLPELAEAWQKEFGSPKKEFYLSHGYKANWILHEQWKIYYPKGLSLDGN